MRTIHDLYECTMPGTYRGLINVSFFLLVLFYLPTELVSAFTLLFFALLLSH